MDLVRRIIQRHKVDPDDSEEGTNGVSTNETKPITMLAREMGDVSV